MRTPAAVRAGKTTGEVRPYDYAAKLFGTQQADARLTSCRTDDPACRGPEKLPESSGGHSNRTAIWGIPVYGDLRDHYQLSEEISSNQAHSLFDPSAQEYVAEVKLWYANGDLQSHLPAWLLLDTFSAEMERRGLSRSPSSPEDYRTRIEWKMRTIGDYYEKVAHKPTVGGPINTEILLPDC